MEITCTDLASIFSSISTFAAVIVALYLANRTIKRKPRLHITQRFTENFTSGKIKLIVTIENNGNVPIILYEYGSKLGNSICTDINTYINGAYEPIIIRPRELVFKEWEYSFDGIVDPNSNIYNLFAKCVFYAEDSMSNKYTLSAPMYMAQDS